MDEGEPQTKAWGGRLKSTSDTSPDLVRRAILIALVTLLAAAGSVGATLLSTPMYRAESTVYFGLQTGTSGSDLFQGGNFASQQAVAYAELVQTPTVLEPVIKQLGLGVTADSLIGGPVVASTLPNTSIVTIDVTDRNAQRAADIANATAQQLGAVVRQLAPRSADNKPTMDATTVRQATAPTAPSSPKLTNNLAAGVVGGLIVGFLLDLLLVRWGWSVLRRPRRRVRNGSTPGSRPPRYRRPAVTPEDPARPPAGVVSSTDQDASVAPSTAAVEPVRLPQG